MRGGSRTVGLLACAALSVVLTTACGGSLTDDEPGAVPSASPSQTEQPGSSETPAPAQDPDEKLSWGPTYGELAEARGLVAEWSAEQLAGQVIVGRYAGTDPAEAGALVRDLHLAGVCVTSDNVADSDQVRATTAAVAEAVAADGRRFPAVVGVDQEGGVVSHLRGVATDFPVFADAGAAIAADRTNGERVVADAARATALELRQLGFTWVFAPVADVTIGPDDPTIGTRSPSTDPALAAAATAAAVTGYDAAGLVSTTKHFPGHGSATADSHEVMPRLDATLPQLRARDLRPFEAAVSAHAPAIMVSHLDVQALAPDVPASLAAGIYDFLRDDLGFEGLAITDSLGMGAVTGREYPAVTAFNAGADLLLMPADTRNTHAVLTAAIESGEITRARAEDSAARVVALQLWQQRQAGDVPVPADAAARAEQAALALAQAAG
ncbi:MAG: glycoside hydrolase family 3 N-terminal domain-containing protein [Nocardioides sp.]